MRGLRPQTLCDPRPDSECTAASTTPCCKPTVHGKQTLVRGGSGFCSGTLTSALGSMTVPRGKRCSPWRSRTPRAASLSGLKPQISSSSAGSHCEEKSLWTVKVGSLSSEFWEASPNLGERVCGQGQFTQLASLFFLLFFFAWREQKLPRITDKHLSTILGRF